MQSVYSSSDIYLLLFSHADQWSSLWKVPISWITAEFTESPAVPRSQPNNQQHQDSNCRPDGQKVSSLTHCECEFP